MDQMLGYRRPNGAFGVLTGKAVTEDLGAA